MAEEEEGRRTVHILCSQKPSGLIAYQTGVEWLIGSPAFLPSVTVVASFRCIHTVGGDPFSPDFSLEADEIRMLLLRGLDIVGAVFVDYQDSKEEVSLKAIEAAQKLRVSLFGERANHDMIAGFRNSDEILFFISSDLKIVRSSVVYEDNPERILWDNGCLLNCMLALKFPLYLPLNDNSDMKSVLSLITERATAKLNDPNTTFLVEGSEKPGNGFLFHEKDLDNSDPESLTCSHFFSERKLSFPSTKEAVGAIQVTILSNQSRSQNKLGFPTVEYFPATEPTKLSVISLRLDILCYASKGFHVTKAIKEFILPGLIDQIKTIITSISSLEDLSSLNELCAYHFLPSGLLIPITAIYDLKYGELEEKQSELRKSLHLRLGLPLDRPLLRMANALNFGSKDKKGGKISRDGSSLLRDVHLEIPKSGVSGGVMSIIDGSYEYYHYLHDGIDDNGWGCAYRSLQTIISWYRLQQYTSIHVPSHREIQEALVQIGDKDRSFIGSRDWIGAIELSFVLDKLLGVSCKIINVRSGDELPEKCRELANHFQTQGTPIMIGGGVLAYTLLGVEYNEASGESAFLILDPHYTGNDDLKKILNGGWCGWKKSVDSKGKSFFLKDRFYNLLLPQRPNMV
ncbi:hypothetical protein LUZ60_007793 [Juncus effusus]|nr:hypothetical protein LUZ60_007793 [Juncus effusus]